MSVNLENRASVYCVIPIEDRENLPQYQAVRELVERYNNGGIVLDLGCSDLAASRKLHRKGYSVIGVDLDSSSLTAARLNESSIPLVQADISSLPIVVLDRKIDTVLLLDVLEHLKLGEAKKLLQDLSASSATIIVSMPIISPLSLPCINEFTKMILHRHRPSMGLFDETHQILADQPFHRKLFAEAGLCIVEEYNTNPFESVSGENWDWKKQLRMQGSNGNGTSRALRDPAQFLTFSILPRFLHPLDVGKRREVTDQLIAYQGLYVLRSGASSLSCVFGQLH